MNTLQPAAVLAGILSLWLATTAFGASALSDLEKKETVYRMYAEGKKDFPAVAELSVQQAMELVGT